MSDIYDRWHTQSPFFGNESGVQEDAFEKVVCEMTAILSRVMPAISQTTFANAFSWMKSFVF